jgi:hypothetical protein
LSIYQQHTNLVDEQIAPEIGVAGLSLSQAIAHSHQTIDECIDQFHTAIATQFHVDYFNFGGVFNWTVDTVDYALGRGAVGLTAAQWLAFIKSRAATSISGVAWTANTLSFDVSAGGADRSALLPLDHLGAALTGITRNGSSAGYSVITVDGRSMAAVPATNGSYVATYAADTTAPVITNVVAVPGSEGVTITWTTDEPSTSVVNYGLDAGLGSQATTPGFTTAHSVTISGLTPATTYYYRVTSADASGNASSGQILTFDTLPPDAPSIAGINPDSGQAGTAQPVTISGANFNVGATAELGTTALQNVVVASETTIQATAPASLPVGTHDLRVTNPDAQSALLPDAYVALAPPPSLSGVVPPAVLVGEQITLSGSGFISGATILIGTTPAEQPLVQSSTSATAIVPLSLAAGAYSVTITNPDGQSDTLANALTVSELPTVGHTTVADFTPGTFDRTAVASGGPAGDGAVILASLGWLDEFEQPGLDQSRWTSGLWDGGGSISLSSGILTVTGAWVRSQLAISSGFTSARLTFNGLPWLNFGLSRGDDLDNPWFLFGVPGWDTSQVYVRYNYNGGFANIPLSGLLGAPHDYAVVRAPGVVRFLVDGQEVHQVSIPSIQPLVTWLSSGSTSAPLAVDSVEMATYEQAGSYLSPPLDAGETAEWREYFLNAQVPAGAGVVARTRSSNNGAVWSAWSADLSSFPSELTLPVGRFLQYELDLSGADGSVTPIIESVSGSYQAASGPGVLAVNVSPTSVALETGDTRQFSAQVLDTNGDPIPDALVSWSVVNGGGTIDQNGLFTAGLVAGDYPNTIVASSGGVTGSASVTVSAPLAPQLVGLSPSIAAVGDTITLSGDSFDNGAQVHVGSTPAGTVAILGAQSITFVVPALADGVYDVRVTNPDGQFATLVNALTVSSLNWRSHTSLSDFQAGGFSATEALSGGDAGDGAVGLANTGFVDAFGGASLNASLWASGLWQGDGALAVAGGQLTVRGAWIRGTATMANGTVSARLTFSGTAWQNFGLSQSSEIDNPWFLFGVPGWDTSQVYVRYNFSGGFADIPLAGLLGAPHDYAIVREAGVMRFLVDGQQVHQVAIPALSNLAIWLSVGSSSGAGTVAESIGILDYAPSGAYLSAPFDAGEHAGWLRLLVDTSRPAGTSVSFRARTSSNGAAWSSWSPQSSSSPVDLSLPAGRYLQYELDLATGSSNASPLVLAVSGAFLPAGTSMVGSVVVSPTSATLEPGGSQQFAAQVLDGNGGVVPGAPVAWSVENGGGTIDQNGLFSAGAVLGTFTDTVVATSDGVAGSASVTVDQAPAPQISAVSPNSALAGETVTIDGANFQTGASVQLGGTAVGGALVLSDAAISFTVPALLPGGYDVTVTNPDGQSATYQNGLTILASSLPVEVIHSSANDFASGTLVNTEITVAEGGEVRLAVAFLDEFDGSQLTSDWSSGTYGSPGSAGVSAGRASVSNGWIQSQFSLGETAVTARLTFTPNGTPYLNFGFAAAGALDQPWFLFGIPGFDTGAVYARTNISGAFYQDLRINGLSLNTPHDFTIRRRPDRIIYEVNGDVVATHLVNDPATTTPLALWLSSGSSSQSLAADWIRTEEYPTSGLYTSDVIDAGGPVSWDSIAADLDLPAGTAVTVSLRTSEDGNAWSGWSSPEGLTGATQPVAIPNGRYIQYELTLTGDGSASPEVRAISLEGETV